MVMRGRQCAIKNEKGEMVVPHDGTKTKKYHHGTIMVPSFYVSKEKIVNNFVQNVAVSRKP